MQPLKIFISSVQNEFAKERKELVDYLLSDPLLGKFFNPFIFECLPANDHSVSQVYLKEVEGCDIYLGILGKEYGYEDCDGISPTEREFDHATLHKKTRLIFISRAQNRHNKEDAFIGKVQDVLVRKLFSDLFDLKSCIYASLVMLLMEKEIIRTAPFDATFNSSASLNDIDTEKVTAFVKLARAKRGFPLHETAEIETILSHLNLMENARVKNAALLLFGKQPQRFFINSEIRCAAFYGLEVEKPLSSYKVFKGNVFELVDQTVEFVLSKLDYRIGTRKEQVQIPGEFEIPKEIISEAIVNAVAHRDYTSNASIQIMLFRNRIEIWNPGSLPLGWTTEKLRKIHNSVPANPLLAEPMYLAGYIERMGTGTSDMIRIAQKYKLAEPQFIQEELFIARVFRPEWIEETTQVETLAQDGGEEQVREQVREQVKDLLLMLNGEYSTTEIMEVLHLKGRRNFLMYYLKPSVDEGLVELTQPDSPKSPTQKYRLTAKGKKIQKALKRNQN